MCPYPQLSTLLLVHSISTRSVLSYNATDDSTPAGIKHTHEIHQKITENHKIKIAITAHTAKGPIARFSITSSDLLDLHFILVHTVNT